MNLSNVKRLYGDHLVREYGTAAIGVEELKFLVKQAEKVEKLQCEIERIHIDLETYQDKYYSEDVQKASTFVLEDSQKRLGING